MKILVWDFGIDLKNAGGPGGYMFNIHEELKEHPCTNIIFLSDLLPLQSKTGNNNEKTLKSKLKACITNSKFYQLLNWFRSSNNSQLSNIDFNQFDIIHFHFTISFLLYSNLLSNFKGKTVLTSHSPQPLCHEIIEDLYQNNFLKKVLKQILEPQELSAWKNVDYLMFPVEEAIEVYFDSKKLKDYYIKNQKKFIFCASSIQERSQTSIKVNVRSKLNIDEKSFIVCYLGRHNDIKGYDKLKEIGTEVISQSKDVFFLIGGKEGPLYGLKNKQWIELGWINYGRQLINESDLFILPNKATYFDLVSLEVLREGTPILMSRAGGNKFFQKFSESRRKGILFYEYNNITEAAKKIIEFKEQPLSVKNEARLANKELFRTEFTTSVFITRYLKLMSSIKD